MPQGDVREQSAVGLDAAFAPRSVAVIGASPKPDNVGHRVLRSIQVNGYRGQLYPIHPTADSVLGLSTRARIADVPDPVDLAIVAVPAPAVLDIAKQCAASGVRALLVLTAGFREAGPEGAAREKELAAIAKSSGMRIIGPNCLGIVNADPAVRLHAIFSDTPARGGSIALMTQSGALGIALLERAHRLGLGIGRFASMGNKLDVSGNDLLLHWEADPGVKLILMHLESVGNPRNFIRIARRVMRSKPIFLVKGGRTSEGARAAGSHTGAMMDADALVDAMVDQAGVVRVRTVEELFDAALALSLQPLPQGNRVGVVTNSGGPAILLADALPAGDLRLGSLSEATLQACGKRLPFGAALANPLDMLAGATPANLTACLADLLSDPGLDSVVAMVTPLVPDDRPWAQAIQQAHALAHGKTLVAVLFGRDATSLAFRDLVTAGIPTYAFPENAAHALAAMHHVAASRQELLEPAPPAPSKPPVRRPGGGPGWTSSNQALEVAQLLGARSLRMLACQSPKEVGSTARAVGFPVAIKVQADGLVHKTEAGAIRLALQTEQEAAAAAEEAWTAVQSNGYRPSGVLVQEMAPRGIEMLVGMVRDEKFGATVTVGLGGIYTEILRDVATRLTPVTPREAQRMIGGLQSAKILNGSRGQGPMDVQALGAFVLALSALADADSSIAEFEVNPLVVLPAGRGVLAIDARLHIKGANA